MRIKFATPELTPEQEKLATLKPHLRRGLLEIRRRQEKLISERVARLPCSVCGKVVPMYGRAKFCEACRHAHRLELQRQRRQQQNTLRRVEHGLLKIVTRKGVSVVAAVLQKCRHCKQKFKPQRITAKYCSAGCRVAAYRKRLAKPAKRKKSRKP